jgi:hypothetical protein
MESVDQSKLNTALDVLWPYIQHTQDCKIDMGFTDFCSCGLTGVKKKVVEALQKERNAFKRQIQN